MRGAVPAFLFLIVVIALIFSSYAVYQSIHPEPGQSELRNVPGKTYGTSERDQSTPKNLPPNARPETPSTGKSGQGGSQAPEPGPNSNSR